MDNLGVRAKRHAEQMSKKVEFCDSDFEKVRTVNANGDPASGNWGIVVLCVEVARKDGQVAVRDSKDRSRGHLVFSNEEWDAFLLGAKSGQFDV